MLTFIKNELNDFRNGVQFTANSKYQLWFSIVRHNHSYGGKEGRYELGIFRNSKYNKNVLFGDVFGWLTLNEAMAISKSCQYFPQHKLNLAEKYQRLANKANSKKKQKCFLRKAKHYRKSVPLFNVYQLVDTLQDDER